MDGSAHEYYYNWLHDHVISHQTPALGLFPRTRYAHVTDNLYCAVTMWALSKVFARLDDGSGRQIELQQSAIKTMRAILFCYTKQLDKLEKFKNNHDPKYSLHTKFDHISGDEIKEDCHRMQLHAVSLYLFYLAQMIHSGLSIIYTMQEVHIVQNLVYYISRSYRIRDFGTWGQGKKNFPDLPELSSTRIALTKAALEICDGLNLFGPSSCNESTLFVDPDAVFRNTSILHGLLPRESPTRDVDAALIQAKGFPAFAIQDVKLCSTIEENVNKELLGRYGYKLGYKLGLDGPSDVECEWPFLLLFQIITCVFNNDWNGVKKYRDILNPLLYKNDGYPTVPYNVPLGPGLTTEACPVVFFQALLILTELLENGLIQPHEIDHRHTKGRAQEHNNRVIQVALLAESTSFQALLSTYGIMTQTPNQIESVYIWPNSKLADLLYYHGSDEGLGLTGRPKRPLGSLCTSRVWKISGKTVVCIPLYQDKQDFYVCKDENYIAKSITTHLKYLRNHWKSSERPTICLMLTSTLFKKDNMNLLKVLNMLNFGSYKDIKIKVGRLQELIPIANHAIIDIHNTKADQLNFQENRILASPLLMRRSLSVKSVIDSEFESKLIKEGKHDNYKFIIDDLKSKSTDDLIMIASAEIDSSSKIIALIEISGRFDSEFKVNGETITENLQHCYKVIENIWLALRCSAAFLRKSVDSLAPAVSTVIVSGRALSLGVFGYTETLISGPLHPSELDAIFHEKIRKQNLLHVSLQQEVLVFIAEIMDDHPELFQGILIIRLGWIIHILYEVLVPQGIYLESLSPYALKGRIYNLLKNESEFCKDSSWPKYRLINGTLGKVPEDFYSRVWKILSHQKILFSLKSNKLDSSHADAVKSTEPMFAMEVEKFMSIIDDPQIRHLVVELFQVLACIVERNPEVYLKNSINVLNFLAKCGVNMEDSLEAASMKFINTFVSEGYGELNAVGECVLA